MAANKSSVKIKKFMPDKNLNSSGILMNDTAVIEELQIQEHHHSSKDEYWENFKLNT